MRSRGGTKRRAPARSDHRGGASIVEVLVAIVLLAIGLLGVAGNAAIALRASAGAARERRATQRAADRVAALREQGCASARSGALVDAAAALSERWSVGSATASAVLVDVEVRWRAPAGERTILLRSGILC
jgi:Tfp pilus assembly protein PilV